MSKRRSMTKPPLKTQKAAPKPKWDDTVQDQTRYKRSEREQQRKNSTFHGQSPRVVARTIRSYSPLRTQSQSQPQPQSQSILISPSQSRSQSQSQPRSQTRSHVNANDGNIQHRNNSQHTHHNTRHTNDDSQHTNDDTQHTNNTQQISDNTHHTNNITHHTNNNTHHTNNNTHHTNNITHHSNNITHHSNNDTQQTNDDTQHTNDTVWNDASRQEEISQIDIAGGDSTLMHSEFQMMDDEDKDVRKQMEQLEASRRVFDSKRQRYQDVTRWCFEITLGRPGVTIEATEAALKQLMDCAATTNAARDDIIKANTVPKLLVLLKVNSETLQSLAIGVLGNLLDGSNKCRNHLLDVGTVAKLVAAMDSNSQRVLENTLGALRNLSVGSDKVKRAMIHEGVVLKMIPFLSSENPCIQEEAAGTLKNLASGGTDLIEIMLQTDVAEVLAHTLLTNDDAVRNQVEGALHNLGRCHVVKCILEMVGSLKNESKASREQVSTLRETMQKKDVEITALKAKIFDLETVDGKTTVELNQKISDLQQELSNVENEKTSVENQANIVQIAFKDTCEELNEIKSDFGKKDEELEKKETEIQALKSEMLEIKQTYTFEMSEAATNLEAQVADVKKDQTEQLLEMKAQMKETQQTLEAWRQEREMLTAKKSSTSMSHLDYSQEAPPLFQSYIGDNNNNDDDHDHDHDHHNNGNYDSRNNTNNNNGDNKRSNGNSINSNGLNNHNNSSHNSSHNYNGRNGHSNNNISNNTSNNSFTTDEPNHTLSSASKQKKKLKQRIINARKAPVGFGSSTPRGIESGSRSKSRRTTAPPPPSTTRTTAGVSSTIASSKRRRFKQVPGFGLVPRSRNASPYTVGSTSTINDSADETQANFLRMSSPSTTRSNVGSVPGSPYTLEDPVFNSTVIAPHNTSHNNSHNNNNNNTLYDNTPRNSHNNTPHNNNTSPFELRSFHDGSTPHREELESIHRPIIQRQSTFTQSDDSVAAPRFSLDDSADNGIASFFSSTQQLYSDKSKHTFG